jgi:hypothetical protein
LAEDARVVTEWIHRLSPHSLLAGWPTLLVTGLGVAIVTFLLGVVLVVKLPEDYFVRTPSRTPVTGARRIGRALVRVARNVLGLVVLVAGFVMALPLVPGPGLLVLLVGLGLVDFPGKHALERKLLGEPHVLRSVNRMRARFGRPPLRTEQRSSQSVVDSGA